LDFEAGTGNPAHHARQEADSLYQNRGMEKKKDNNLVELTGIEPVTS
jgi:hypothetical protein